MTCSRLEYSLVLHFQGRSAELRTKYKGEPLDQATLHFSLRRFCFGSCLTERLEETIVGVSFGFDRAIWFSKAESRICQKLKGILQWRNFSVAKYRPFKNTTFNGCKQFYVRSPTGLTGISFGRHAT